MNLKSALYIPTIHCQSVSSWIIFFGFSHFSLRLEFDCISSLFSHCIFQSINFTWECGCQSIAIQLFYLTDDGYAEDWQIFQINCRALNVGILNEDTTFNFSIFMHFFCFHAIFLLNLRKYIFPVHTCINTQRRSLFIAFKLIQFIWTRVILFSFALTV